jgi:methionine biosynthesis protein MetW
MSKLRTDLALLTEWIEPNSHVLDLGCGDGSLLAHLREKRQVTGYGLEIDETQLVHCIRAGVNVIHADLNKGLSDFVDNSFDYVITTQTLQAIRRPDKLLLDMLRVGREGIITFSNFGHWRCRFQLFSQGTMPVLADGDAHNEWYSGENIHLCTMKDFEKLCKEQNIEILQRAVVDLTHRSRRIMNIFPNLFGEIVLYRLHHS